MKNQPAKRVNIVSEIRHTDLNMTNRYVRLFGTALKSQAEKFNPLNDIDL